MRSRKMILLSAVLVVLTVSATASATASASPPLWRFGGTALPEFEGETVVGAAISSSLKTVAGSTTCQHFLYNMEVWNEIGYGNAWLDELPLFECTTTASHCTVTSIEAQNLPWFSFIENYSSKPYLVINEIDVKIGYGGSGCVLPKSVTLEGTAGGAINNENSTATFSKASFEKTGTAMHIGTENVEWTGEFTMEAFEKNRDKSVEIY
jgi:hypothetical protein